jgi:hypothetical protein
MACRALEQQFRATVRRTPPRLVAGDEERNHAGRVVGP